MKVFQLLLLLLFQCLGLHGWALHASKSTDPPSSVLWDTKTTSTTLHDKVLPPRGPLSRIRRKLFRKTGASPKSYSFSYDYDQMDIGKRKQPKVGVMLVHPVGVGIGRWFYERLFRSLNDQYAEDPRFQLIVLAPDLLGSGSASSPTVDDDDIADDVKRLPLFNISDWTDQLDELMAKTESEETTLDRWCVVANGGCSPIALQLAQRSVEGNSTFLKPVSNVILSSLPRLPFFLTSSDPQKVSKSYSTLCGPIGNLFWWYSCRNKGAFIQKFSERNLVADPANLGTKWRPNCYETARLNNGKSRFSTFSFLAGALQDGSVKSLNALKDSSVVVDIIKGRDTRRNQAKSYFWQKPKKKKKQVTLKDEEKRQTFRDYIEENGNGGREISIGGRISLAHEDAVGYADAMASFLSD